MEKAMERLLTWILLSEHDVIFSICVYVPRDGSIFVYDPSDQGKMAWILRWIIFNLHFLSSGFTVAGISVKVSIVAALLNFLLFFLSMKKIRRMGANFKAKTIHKKKARAYKAKTITPKKKNGAMHECAVCHRTELDDPELEFRYCSKCDGNYEYCQDHLFTHKHVKR